MNKKTITDFNFENKKVLMRVDFNVPIQKGKITDNARIVAALPSIEYILKNNGSVILMSHFGRPKNGFEEKFSLCQIQNELEKLLNKTITIAKDCIGEEVEKLANNLSNGEVLLLENVRFHSVETSKSSQERKVFAKELSSLADIYINEAFGTAHREHASTTTVAEFLPSGCGFLMEKEINFLHNSIQSPQKPFVAILGGAKVSSKLPLIESLVQTADKVIIGGGMAYTFYRAMGYEIGKSLLEKEMIENCRKLLEEHREKIVLPVDNAIGKIDFDSMTLQGELQIVSANKIPQHLEGLDIGQESIHKFQEIIATAQTVLWNGPMGIFECPATAKGTFAIADSLAEITQKNNAVTIIGGGDSAAAIKQVKLTDKVSHVSTGGGAALEFLNGETLPGLAAIMEK